MEEGRRGEEGVEMAGMERISGNRFISRTVRNRGNREEDWVLLLTLSGSGLLKCYKIITG